MAVRAIIGIDRIIGVDTGIAVGAAMPNTPLYNIDLSASASTHQRTATNFLQIVGAYQAGIGNTVTKSCAAMLPLNDVVALSASSVLVLGVRFAIGSASTGLHLKAPGDSGAVFTLFGTSGVGNGELGATNSNKEYYLEVKFDIPAKLAYRRLDGAALAPLTIPDWVIDRFTNNTKVFAVFGYHLTFVQGLAGWANVMFKDIYVLEKTADGIASDFLGPQVVKPITLTAFDAPYTNNGSNLTNLAALNTAVSSAAARTAPLVTSDTVESMATAKVTADTGTSKINGIAFIEEARRLSGSDAKLKCTVVDGQAKAVSTATLTDTLNSWIVPFVSARSPDGSVWTKAKLESLALQLNPVTNQ